MMRLEVRLSLVALDIDIEAEQKVFYSLSHLVLNE